MWVLKEFRSPNPRYTLTSLTNTTLHPICGCNKSHSAGCFPLPMLFHRTPIPSLCTHLSLLICCDIFLATEPSLQQEKWAEKAPSAAWSLPITLGCSRVSLLLLWLALSLQPGDIMVRDYEIVLPAGQADRTAKKLYVDRNK